MITPGIIIIIEDDPDDQDLLKNLFLELNVPNELKMFSDGEAALDYLRQPEVKPFVVISDINMPRMSGFQLREQILNDPALAIKCIPFIFCSTGATPVVVEQAYTQYVQGIFQKPFLYQQWKDIIHAILLYWSLGISPNRMVAF